MESTDRSSSPIYFLRKAYPHEREIIREHIVSIHLEISARNEIELKDQINDLPEDFPALYNPELFSHPSTYYLLAALKSDSNVIIGSVGFLELDENDNYYVDVEQPPPFALSPSSGVETNQNNYDNSTTIATANNNNNNNSDTNNDITDSKTPTIIKKAKINSFFISSGYRKLGIGTVLMKSVLTYAKSRHVQQIFLLTLREVYEEAVLFYQSFGFKIVREYPGVHHYMLVDMTLMIDDSK